MRYTPMEPALVDFAKWLTTTITAHDKPLLQVMIDNVGLENWTTFEAPVKKYAGRYAQVTEGAFKMNHMKHYKAAGETMCIMAKAGDLPIEGITYDTAKGSLVTN